MQRRHGVAEAASTQVCVQRLIQQPNDALHDISLLVSQLVCHAPLDTVAGKPEHEAAFNSISLTGVLVPQAKSCLTHMQQLWFQCSCKKGTMWCLRGKGRMAPPAATIPLPSWAA